MTRPCAATPAEIAYASHLRDLAAAILIYVEFPDAVQDILARDPTYSALAATRKPYMAMMPADLLRPGVMMEMEPAQAAEELLSILRESRHVTFFDGACLLSLCTQSTNLSLGRALRRHCRRELAWIAAFCQTGHALISRWDEDDESALKPPHMVHAPHILS